jgi:hypothetical protein
LDFLPSLGGVVRAKLTALLMGLVAIVCLGVGVSTSASAAPASTTPYPPPSCPLLTVSTTNPFPGQTITIAGTNFNPNVAVTIELDTNVALAHVNADASGAFSTDVKLPSDLVGNHVISATGTNLGNCPVDPIQITVQSNTLPSSSSNGGGLASTGVDILTGLVIALGLIAAGVFATRTGRQRAGRHNA